MIAVLFEDETLCIKRQSAEDAQAMFEMIEDNRNHLRKFLPWLDQNRSQEQTQEYLVRCEQEMKRQLALHYGLWEKGKFIGAINSHHIHWLHRRSSVGYMLSEQAQGRGVMTRAVAIFVHYLFRQLHLHRIEINCATANLKSAAIAIRLGFTEEGIRRECEWLYDHFVDNRSFSMLKPEFDQSSNPVLHPFKSLRFT